MRLVLTLAGVVVLSLLAALSCMQDGSDAVGYPPAFSGETEGEIWDVVDRAVTSLEYTTARSKDELESILARAYAGPVLTELTAALWRDRPNDDVVPVEILNRRLVEVYGSDARAEVGVYFRDWTDGSTWRGTGYFTLARLKQGWRIVEFDYKWDVT